MEVAVDLPIATYASVAFTLALSFTSDFVPEDPVAIIQQNHVFRKRIGGGLFGEFPKQFAQVISRNRLLLQC